MYKYDDKYLYKKSFLFIELIISDAFKMIVYFLDIFINI